MRNHSTKRGPLGRIPSIILGVLIFTCIPKGSFGQAAPKTDPDVVVFPNGEKLIGQFENMMDGSAKFKSDTIGEVTIDLSKVQEFHTSGKFAVIAKNIKLGRKQVDGQIPHGSLSVANKTISVDAGNGQPARTVAVADANTIIDEAAFQAALHRPNILQDWKGAVAFGSSIVEATQNSLSFNTSVGLVRTVPAQDWLDPNNRTTLDFSDSFGKVTQPGTPTVKTSIYHADAERDEYFSSRFYALADAAFDHNFSQGLDLQQTYGGGIGVTVIQRMSQTLDFKGTIGYQKQAFDVTSLNQNLADSVFAETYTAKLIHGIALKQQIAASPAWTNMNAYSGNASVALTFPVYKRFGFNVSLIDSFINNPPPTFKKNSFQFATGITYTLP